MAGAAGDRLLTRRPGAEGRDFGARLTGHFHSFDLAKRVEGGPGEGVGVWFDRQANFFSSLACSSGYAGLRPSDGRGLCSVLDLGLMRSIAP